MTDVSLHWGAVRAPESDCAVVVDVLSFSTTLSVAVDQGIEVLPYRWKDGTAAAFAREQSAALAVGRSEHSPSAVSLSPGSIRRSREVQRLVLPSPNGSTISHQLGSTGAVVVGGCLRNARAVADWVVEQSPSSVAVVAAGERWPDGSLRPALEDLLGAGAIIEAMPRDVVLDGDAYAALAAFREARPQLLDRLLACPSGRELVEAGFRDDVLIAAELDQSTAVPLLDGDRFVPA